MKMILNDMFVNQVTRTIKHNGTECQKQNNQNTNNKARINRVYAIMQKGMELILQHHA